MDFKQLRSFVAVADCGSFTQAAAQLYTSQPTVSAHIRQLEEELQQRLFLRTTKSLSITPAGHELYTYAAQVLAMQDRLLAGWQQRTQILALSASTIPSAYLLPELLPRFRAEHPEIRFEIHQSDSTGALQALRSGLCELALTGMENSEEGLMFTPFCRDSMVLITPNTADFVEAQSSGTPITALLQAHPLLLREAGSGSQRCVDEFLHSLGLTAETLHVTARLNDQESIKNLVAAGLGLSIVSARSVRREQSRGDLLVFPLSGAAERQFYLVTRENDLLHTATQQFFDFAVQFYRKTCVKQLDNAHTI